MALPIWKTDCGCTQQVAMGQRREKFCSHGISGQDDFCSERAVDRRGAKTMYLERWPDRSWEDDAGFMERHSYEGQAAVAIHAARTVAQKAAASKGGEG